MSKSSDLPRVGLGVHDAMHLKRDFRRRLAIGIGIAFGARAIGVPLACASTDTVVAKNEKEASMAAKDLTEEVRQFLTAYNTAFETFDAPTIATFYHVPCITMRGDGSIHSFQTRAEIEKFFGGVAEKYSSDGYRSGTFYDLEVVPIGARSALATLTWEQLREDKSILRKWRHSYNLVRMASGWQILASTFHLG